MLSGGTRALLHCQPRRKATQPRDCRHLLTGKQVGKSSALKLDEQRMQDASTYYKGGSCRKCLSVKFSQCASREFSNPNGLAQWRWPAGAMTGLSRGLRTDDHGASLQSTRHDRHSGRPLDPQQLDLSVNGRQIGPVSAKPAAQPRHSVSWEDRNQRPATSPEPAHASTSRQGWAGGP